MSNAFAKREFGKPFVEQFFPTVNLQKIVDCSGLMFPGHGTPTCIIFGQRPLSAAKRKTGLCESQRFCLAAATFELHQRIVACGTPLSLTMMTVAIATKESM